MSFGVTFSGGTEPVLSQLWFAMAALGKRKNLPARRLRRLPTSTYGVLASHKKEEEGHVGAAHHEAL
jgi:hypothetical protein